MRLEALVLLVAVLAVSTPAARGAETTALDVGDGERLLVVAPHPDDETLAAGGLVQRVLARGGVVRVVLVTAGDGYVEAVSRETGLPRPRPTQYIAYGERRVAEARAAVRVLGGHRVRLQLLGFPDGRLERLLTAHWFRRHPDRSPTTAATRSPYHESMSPRVAYDGDDLRRELHHLLRETKPTIVALPDPLDAHPDHRAAALFTLLALGDWTAEGGRVPRLLAYLVHWPGWPTGWNGSPAPAALELPPSLPARGLVRVVLALAPAEVATKRAALAEYTTQQEDMASFLGAFVRESEPFTVLGARELGRAGEMIERHDEERRD